MNRTFGQYAVCKCATVRYNYFFQVISVGHYLLLS